MSIAGLAVIAAGAWQAVARHRARHSREVRQLLIAYRKLFMTELWYPQPDGQCHPLPRTDDGTSLHDYIGRITDRRLKAICQEVERAHSNLHRATRPPRSLAEAESLKQQRGEALAAMRKAAVQGLERLDRLERHVFPGS